MPSFLLPALSAGAGIYNSLKGQNTAQQAGQASQVDVAALDEQTRRIAKQNALDSAALEQQLTPEVPQLRTAANTGILAGLTPTAGEASATSLLQSQIGQPVAGDINPGLLNEAVAKARSDLALGGQLPQELQNLVTRTALAHAGAVGGGGLGLGRDIAARDLGLTSLGLQKDRLLQAASLGGQEAGVQQFNVGTHFQNANNLLQQIQMLQAISQGQYGRQLAAGQFGQSIQQPITGLDPTAVANVTVGNQNNQAKYLANQANIQGQQGNNYLALAGNLLGGKLGGLFNFGGGSSSNPGGMMQNGEWVPNK